MKRINLSVDLENNEVFEQEIKEAMRAQVRGIVREEGAALIRNETEKEARRLFKESSWNFSSTVKRVAREKLEEAVREEIKNPEIAKMISDSIEKKVEEIVAKAVADSTRNVESRVYKTFTAIMTDEFNKHFMQIIGKG